jgi:hypothetical protein
VRASNAVAETQGEETRAAKPKERETAAGRRGLCSGKWRFERGGRFPHGRNGLLEWIPFLKVGVDPVAFNRHLYLILYDDGFLLDLQD